MKLQSTRPQTKRYSFADSPVGLTSWLYAVFQDVSGTPGKDEASFTLHRWFTPDYFIFYFLVAIANE